MKSLPGIVLLLCVAVQFAQSEKILVVSFFSSKSHKITYMRLIEELASRGHEITVVTPIKSDKAVKNIREIFTINLEALMEGKFDAFEMKESGKTMNPFMMLEEFGDICRQSYDVPEVKALLNEKFDLVFFQPLFNDCVLGLIHRLQAPLVLFMPVSAPNFIVDKIGGYLPPSFVSNVFLGYSDEMTFPQRFINFGTNIFTNAVLKFYYHPYMTELYREKLGHDLPPVADILGNASLLLSNGHFALSRPKPYLPNVIDVGGIHSRPAKPLPKDLEDFVSKSKDDGFILFSLGSAIKGSMMPDEKRKMILKVFSKLKQQVLWKWETETMPDLPKNVKLSKWLPQQDLLGHKNIKMFITHCGGGGTEEAIYHGVPLLGMPFFGDQDMNARQAKNQGFLHQLDWTTLNEETLMAGIQEILQNKKYQENVDRLSKVFKDQPNDPLQRGVYWVEYVLRHKGAPQLQSAGKNLNFLQYHSLDVIGAYFAIIFGSLYIIFAALRWIVRKVCGCGGSKGKKSSQNKKNQ